MQNPNSAIERIKNHLAYKLGQAMIEYHKNGGGYLALFKKLYNIKKQHKKEKLIYQETIKVFPTLKYPELKHCPDYNEALKCYFHLSYMLGEVLIKTFKTWYKGSIFTLAKNIKKANKEFQIFKKTFDQFKIYDVEIPKDLLSNKSLFLEKILQIEKLLKTHKDYKPIIENIFHNFDYFIKNFNLIEEWLLSNDFNEKYKKENHPYPSLLDPKKLNDEKEKINYKTIPAQLAWEMNLPLPDNYEFVFLSIFGAGSAAMDNFLRGCKISINARLNNNYNRYLDSYKLLINSKNYNVLALSGYKFASDTDKLFFLITKKIPYLCIVRDPISLLKPLVNHHQDNNQIIRKITLDFDYENYIKSAILYHQTFVKNGIIEYGFGKEPTLHNLLRYLDGNMNILNYRIESLKHSIEKIYYMNMDDITQEHAFSSFKKLSRIFHFPMPKDEFFFKAKVCRNDILVLLPFTLTVFLKDYEDIDDKDEESVEILISTYQITKNIINKININHMIFKENTYFGNLVCLCNQLDYDILKKHEKIFDRVKKYIHDFIYTMYIQEQNERNKLFREEDVLNYLKKNKDLALKVKNMLDKDYAHIKQNRPDIIASWKYYQEFEKMCEELDGKNEIKQIENNSN
ncbi:DUF2972 domain-containing protein [Campylobacter taeniopygiae]|uniref:DUF2972 domain-containing protein n=1 Tax=Campylobacter taeniopygiae TaxID=2510188 RepID=UPI003D6A1719